jgi:hypothetical protein
VYRTKSPGFTDDLNLSVPIFSLLTVCPLDVHHAYGNKILGVCHLDDNAYTPVGEGRIPSH